MKTEREITEVLLDHEKKTRILLEDWIMLEAHAKELRWSIDRVKGYMEGVAFAYRWCLEDEMDDEL